MRSKNNAENIFKKAQIQNSVKIILMLILIVENVTDLLAVYIVYN